MFQSFCRQCENYFLHSFSKKLVWISLGMHIKRARKTSRGKISKGNLVILPNQTNLKKKENFWCPKKTQSEKKSTLRPSLAICLICRNFLFVHAFMYNKSLKNQPRTKHDFTKYMAQCKPPWIRLKGRKGVICQPHELMNCFLVLVVDFKLHKRKKNLSSWETTTRLSDFRQQKRR